MSKLNEKQVLYVVKPMKFNGKSYETGDPFPWAKNGCSSRRLQILINARNLSSTSPDYDEEETIVDETPKPKAVAKAKKKKKTIQVNAIED